MNSTVRFGMLTALMLSASCAVAHQASINGNYLAIYRTPWHMVQDLFITQPAAEVKKQHTTRRGIFKSLAWGVGAGLAAKGIHSFGLVPFFSPGASEAPEQEMRDFSSASSQVPKYNYQQGRHNPQQVRVAQKSSDGFLGSIAKADTRSVTIACCAIGTVVAGLGIAGTLINRFFFAGPRFLKAEEKKQVEVVLDQWNEVRSYFPQSLQPIFDTLHELRRTESAEYAINVERALEIVKSEVALNAR